MTSTPQNSYSGQGYQPDGSYPSDGSYAAENPGGSQGPSTTLSGYPPQSSYPPPTQTWGRAEAAPAEPRMPRKIATKPGIWRTAMGVFLGLWLFVISLVLIGAALALLLPSSVTDEFGSVTSTTPTQQQQLDDLFSNQ